MQNITVLPDLVCAYGRKRMNAGGDGERIRTRCRVSHRRAGRDIARVVARLVGHQQRDHTRRMTGRRQPPALRAGLASQAH
jgi:hypothetical protein